MNVAEIQHQFVNNQLADLGTLYLTKRFPQIQSIVLHSDGTIIAYLKKDAYIIVKSCVHYYRMGTQKPNVYDKGLKAIVINEALGYVPTYRNPKKFNKNNDSKNTPNYSYATTIVGVIQKAIDKYHLWLHK